MSIRGCLLSVFVFLDRGDDRQVVPPLENVSFGLTLCAERAAVAAAIQAGHRDFVGIAVAADTAVPVIPCGACRQFLAEFSTDLAIYCICRNGLQNTWSLSQLLPFPREGVLHRRPS